MAPLSPLAAWIFLLACAASASYQCPDASSPCSLDCSSTASCIRKGMNCSTNANCTLFCGNSACIGATVDGLYEPDPSEFAANCANTFACNDALIRTRPSPMARFLCSGWSCDGAILECQSEQCELVCRNDSWACKDTSFVCPGGDNNTCNLVCERGCDDHPNVTCLESPCTVTVSGKQNLTMCAPGQKVCPLGECVSADTTVCPSRCTKNDPCKTAFGNSCREMTSIPGGSINCTCNEFFDPIEYHGSRGSTVVSGCRAKPEIDGDYLTMKTYANQNCTGNVTKIRNFPWGVCVENLPEQGQYAYGRCSNLNHCLIIGTGECDPLLSCSTPVPNSCINGTKIFCGMISGAVQWGSTAAAGLLLLIAF